MKKIGWVLCIFALGSVSSARAGVEHVSCSSAVDEYDRMTVESDEARCDRAIRAIHDDGRPVYLLIEGASGFSVKYMAAVKSDLDVACVNAATPDSGLSESQKKSVRTAFKVLGGERQNISKPYLLMASEGILRSGGENWVYFRQGHWREAIACAKRITNATTANGADSRLRIMGYSMGGYVALKAAKELADEGHPIQKGLTIDPVGRGLRSVPSLISNRDSWDMPVPEDTEWRNLYQKSDKRSAGIGIKGSALAWADVNTEVSSQELDATGFKGGAKLGHRAVFKTGEFQALIEDFVK